MEIANAVGANSGAPRTNRVMLEGVGARVIRGPDWKWGKQVRFHPRFFFNIHKILYDFILGRRRRSRRYSKEFRIPR